MRMINSILSSSFTWLPTIHSSTQLSPHGQHRTMRSCYFLFFQEVSALLMTSSNLKPLLYNVFRFLAFVSVTLLARVSLNLAVLEIFPETYVDTA